MQKLCKHYANSASESYKNLNFDLKADKDKEKLNPKKR